jgi:hypothetical protein
MRIVVTGGQGRLGTEVARRLEARGATVTSASRRTGVDLATGAGLEAALHGADCVVHAAVHRWRQIRVNLGGTRRLSISWPNVQRLHPSSMCRSSAATAVPCGITAPSTPASWYWSAASFRSRWFGLPNSTPWSPQLRAQRRWVRWRWYPEACHSSHAITVGLPRRSPTLHSGRHRRVISGLLIGLDLSVSASPRRQH